jgi:regulatory protein
MAEENRLKNEISEEEGLSKAQHYCAYQERCVYEVELKLYEWNVRQEDRNAILDALAEEGFLHEGRFAEAYVSGKFRIKGWGKQKIKAGLYEKRLSKALIEQALSKISNAEYRATLLKKIQQWVKENGAPIQHAQRSRLLQHLALKGFEQELVFEILRKQKWWDVEI